MLKTVSKKKPQYGLNKLNTALYEIISAISALLMYWYCFSLLFRYFYGVIFKIVLIFPVLNMNEFLIYHNSMYCFNANLNYVFLSGFILPRN